MCNMQTSWDRLVIVISIAFYNQISLSIWFQGVNKNIFEDQKYIAVLVKARLPTKCTL